MTKGNSKRPADFILKVEGEKITLRARVKSSKRSLVVLCLLLIAAMIGLIATDPESIALLLKLFLSLSGAILLRLLTAQA